MTVVAEAEMAAVPMSNEASNAARDLREDMDTSEEFGKSRKAP
jgi:hypothetical protein